MLHSFHLSKGFSAYQGDEHTKIRFPGIGTSPLVEEMPPPRSTGCVDPGWEHGVAQDEKKKKVKCNYCGKVVSGGIFRLKQHLARISGEVTHCERASEEVCLSMRRNLEGCRSARKRRQSEYEQASFGFVPCQYKDSEEATASYKHKRKKVTGDKNFVIRFAPLRSLGYVDPGWEHCVAQDDKKKRVKCNYCDKIISGGINRFKQHLARIPGEVAYCEKAPEDVYLKIKENMKWHRSGRRPRKPDTKEISAFYMQSENEDEHEEQDEGFSEGSGKEIVASDEKAFDDDIRNMSGLTLPGASCFSPEPPLKRSRLDSVFLNSLKSQTSSHYRQGKQKKVSDKRSRKDVLSAISKFFYHAGIPSTAANSPYFHRMLELVSQYGPGLKGPSSRLISGLFLQDEITSSRKYLEELKASWTSAGCSILADSWKDVQGRVIINLLVSCSRGIYFISSVDATDIIEDYGSLFLLLDRVVDEVGEENVVQVVTKDTASFKAAGMMLEEKRKNLFWTPCAVNSIDQMLEDFLKIKWVGECFEKARKITKFVYNSAWVLNYMKKEFTGGKELLVPGNTKISTSFYTIQSLLDRRIGLKRMFQSKNWLSLRFSQTEGGKQVEKIVMNSAFWKKMQYVKKSLEPLVQVLERIDSDKSLGCVYNEMYRAKLAIKAINGDEVQKYGPFWSVIDGHWSSLFHHPLYVAAYFLNPSYRYRQDFITHPEVVRGLNECIVRLESDSARRITASMQIPEFVSAKADFGTDLAISTRTELDPASWWQQHGISCLELQRIAIRVLSQTCSSIGCEHSWSIHDQLHSRRHNSLSQKRWDGLTYVHYNLRLREPLLRGNTDDLLSFESGISENVLHDWIDGTDRQLEQDDDEGIPYNEVEHFCGDANDEGSEEKRCTEMVTLSDDLEHLEDSQAVGALTTDDEDDDDDDVDGEDLNFLDDDGTE